MKSGTKQKQEALNKLKTGFKELEQSVNEGKNITASSIQEELVKLVSNVKSASETQHKKQTFNIKSKIGIKSKTEKAAEETLSHIRPTKKN